MLHIWTETTIVIIVILNINWIGPGRKWIEDDFQFASALSASDSIYFRLNVSLMQNTHSHNHTDSRILRISDWISSFEKMKTNYRPLESVSWYSSHYALNKFHFRFRSFLPLDIPTLMVLLTPNALNQLAYISIATVIIFFIFFRFIFGSAIIYANNAILT